MKYILFVFLLALGVSGYAQNNNQSTGPRISFKFNRLQYFNGTQWKAVADSGTSGASDTASYIPYNTPVSDTGLLYVGLSRISGTLRMVVSSKTLIDTTGASGSSLIPKYQNDTAKQNIRNQIPSGVFTSTTYNIANVTTSSTPTNGIYYSRNGEIVIGSFNATLTPTASATLTYIDFDLPIATDMSGGTAKVIGVADVSGVSGWVSSNTATNRGRVSFISTGTTSTTINATFLYRIQ